MHAIKNDYQDYEGVFENVDGIDASAIKALQMTVSNIFCNSQQIFLAQRRTSAYNHKAVLSQPIRGVSSVG